jgi:hypothetical protein
VFVFTGDFLLVQNYVQSPASKLRHSSPYTTLKARFNLIPYHSTRQTFKARLKLDLQPSHLGMKKPDSRRAQIGLWLFSCLEL